MYAKIAVVGLLRRKGRTIFTASAVAVAVSMAILLVSIGVGLKQGTAAMYEGSVDYWIMPKESSVTDIVSSSEKTMLGNVHQSIGKILSNPDIKGATPVLNRLLYASSPGRSPKVILGMGIIPAGTDTLPVAVQDLTPGDYHFTNSAWSGEAVINEKTAKLLELKVGDTMRLGASASGLNNSNNSFRVMGIISETGYSISPIAVLHLSELQELTGNLKGDRANYIIARGSGSMDYIRGLFPDALVLSNAEYSVYNVASDKKILATAIAVSAISALIAVLFISSTMVLSINEKKQEFALMKAIGISQRSIAKMVLYESIILSLIGGIMGILLSRIGQEILNMSAYRFFEAGQVSVVSPVLQLGGVVIALAAGVLSGLIPVIMTKRIDLTGTPG